MKEAGFAQVAEPSTVSNDMVYWKKGDLRVTLARDQAITHSELIDRAVSSAVYNLKRHAKIEFKPLTLVNEPYANPPK